MKGFIRILLSSKSRIPILSGFRRTFQALRFLPGTARNNQKAKHCTGISLLTYDDVLATLAILSLVGFVNIG